ncbi:MAG: GIY-YIG nuclease family protein [Nitrospiraceae bacterium]
MTRPETAAEPNSPETWLVYMLECADGTLYTGIARDLARRIAAHNAGTGAKYTRPRRPVTLRYSEPHATKGAALQREAALKRLSRAEKLALTTCANPRPLS